MVDYTHGNVIHGNARRTGRHPLYSRWANIMQRCYNSNHPQYDDYGGRGITVCDEWHSVAVFIRYVEDELGSFTQYSTIDRKNNNLGYVVGNIRWADRVTQNSNRRNNISITAFGVTKLLSEWAVELKIPYSTLKDRYRVQKLRGEELLNTNSRRNIK